MSHRHLHRARPFAERSLSGGSARRRVRDRLVGASRARRRSASSRTRRRGADSKNVGTARFKKATKILFLTGRLYARSLVQSSTVGWSDSGGIFRAASMAGHVEFAFLRQLHRRTYLSMVFRSVLLATACARGDFAILCMRSHISLCVLVGTVPFS